MQALITVILIVGPIALGSYLLDLVVEKEDVWPRWKWLPLMFASGIIAVSPFIAMFVYIVIQDTKVLFILSAFVLPIVLGITLAYWAADKAGSWSTWKWLPLASVGGLIAMSPYLVMFGLMTRIVFQS